MSNQIFYISGNRKFYINENSGVLVLNNLDLRTNSRPTINGTGVLLSGEGATLPSTIVYTTGSQTIGGIKTFSSPAGFISGLFGTEIIGLNVTAPNLIYNTGNQTISGVKTFANGANQILNTTYSNLTGLKATSGLLSGQLYRISDFILKWNNQSYNDQTVKTSASGEPLIVTALSNKQISHIAQSEAYPQDTIYYNIDASGSYSWGTINNTAAIPDFKGWIYRRVDNILNIDIPYDWRNITVNCCRPDVSSIPYYSGNHTYNKFDVVIQTGINEYNSPRGKLYFSSITGNSGNVLTNTNFWTPLSAFTESGTYFSTDEDTEYGMFRAFRVYDEYEEDYVFRINLPALTGSRIQQPTFTSNMTGQGTFYLSDSYNIKIEGGYSNVIQGGANYNNTIGSSFQKNTILSFRDNTIGNNFANNNIGVFYSNTIGNNFTDNLIGSVFISNSVGDSFLQNTVTSSNLFYYNTIGSFFNGNTIENFQTNTIGHYFFDNIIGGIAYNNTIGIYFQTNTIGSNFLFNTIGNSFAYNTIGNNCYSNTIANTCYGNTIGNVFASNTIGNGFSGNTIGNNFTSNTSEDNFIGINFSTSTHVYSGYSTTLFKNAALSQRLRYFNSSDQLVVTDPTA